MSDGEPQAAPERYEPPSEFLKAVIAHEIPLGEDEIGRANFRQLMAMLHDEDVANRDWATLLVAQQETHTAEICDALLAIAANENEADVVRAEAVLGLAQRDPQLTLPFVQAALRQESVSLPYLEAALLCPHPSLIQDLRVWAEPSNHSFADQIAKEALAASEQLSADEYGVRGAHALPDAIEPECRAC